MREWKGGRWREGTGEMNQDQGWREGWKAEGNVEGGEYGEEERSKD